MRALRVLWVLLALGLAAVVIAREWSRVDERLAGMPPGLLAAAAGLTVAAKLVLAENARLAAARADLDLGWPAAARLYNLSQLGKYVPGAVWQFVGRAVAYRDRGARAAAIRDALVAESVWVAGGAAVVGLALAGPTVVPAVLGALGPGTRVWVAVGGGLALVAAAVAAARWRRAARRVLAASVPTPRAVAVQALVWALLGAGFLCCARAAGVPVGPVAAVGLFAAAYAVGFAVLLAPAGLGVREAVLVAGLLPLADAGAALAAAVVSRLVYVGVEVVLVVVPEAVLAARRR